MPAEPYGAATEPSLRDSRGDVERPAPLRGVVVVHSQKGAAARDGHDAVTQTTLAERIAALKNFDFAGCFDSARRYSCPVYFVPDDTLVNSSATADLAIRGEQDLFGAVVPYPFMATKVITHPLIAPDAFAPPGWSRHFGTQVTDAVLVGFSAFTRDDARQAGARLLETGPVRVKPVRERGGRGQIVADDMAALDVVLEETHPAVLAHFGIVLEENLTDVSTYSVGQVRVDELVASYVGVQRLTRNNSGASAYGGSDLLVVRGGYDDLLAREVSFPARTAILHACTYESAAVACFPGFFASRRNYDIAVGTDAAGARRCGVLEQSWRIGGASGAEIAALECFRADPDCRTVRAACFECYGNSERPAPPCTVYYQGTDPEVGAITKYLRVEPHGDQR